MSYYYRRMNITDLEEIHHVAKVDMTIPALFDPDISVTEAMILDRVEFFKKMPETDFVDVAVSVEGSVVGFHVVNKGTFFGRAVGNVSTLWVDPEHRRNGIARELKTRAEVWAKELGLYCLYTHTFAANAPTVALNQNLGFEIISHRLQKKL